MALIPHHGFFRTDDPFGPSPFPYTGIKDSTLRIIGFSAYSVQNNSIFPGLHGGETLLTESCKGDFKPSGKSRRTHTGLVVFPWLTLAGSPKKPLRFGGRTDLSIIRSIENRKSSAILQLHRESSMKSSIRGDFEPTLFLLFQLPPLYFRLTSSSLFLKS